MKDRQPCIHGKLCLAIYKLTGCIYSRRCPYGCEFYEPVNQESKEGRCKMTGKLKSCPFCGGEAELNLLLGNYCVTCKSCMGAIFPAAGMTEEEAIEVWNKRAGEHE